MNQILKELATKDNPKFKIGDSFQIDGRTFRIGVDPDLPGNRVRLETEIGGKTETQTVQNLVNRYDPAPKIVDGTPQLSNVDLEAKVDVLRNDMEALSNVDGGIRAQDVPIITKNFEDNLRNNPDTQSFLQISNSSKVASVVNFSAPFEKRIISGTIETPVSLARKIESVEAKIDSIFEVKEVKVEVESILDEGAIEITIKRDPLGESIRISGPVSAPDLAVSTLILDELPEGRPRSNAISLAQEGRARSNAVTELPGSSTKIKEALENSAQDLLTKANRAYGLSDETLQTIRNILPNIKKKWVLLGTLGIGLVAGLSYFGYTLSLGKAGAQHQENLNGCYLYDSLTNTKKKISLLTCGDFATGSMIQTCLTQSFSPSANPPSVISECGKQVFNPCAKTSTSRSTDPAVPLVPNVCNSYLYKGSAPAPITGVTVKDACKTEDGKAIPVNQACSGYCKTMNFNLPDNLTLMCIQVDFDTAFIDLMTTLGYDPVKLFPPASAPQTVSTVSRPLAVTTGVLGLVFIIMLVVYWRKIS